MKPVSSDTRAKSAAITMGVGMGVNLVLFAVKMYVGLASSSISVLMDAFNNLGDVAACLIAVFSFLLSVKKSGKGIDYGYGRMEYIADFIMAVIVCVVGAEFLYLASERFVLPYLLTFTWLYFGIIAAAALVKVGLGFFYRFRNKGIDSSVLKASSLDSFTDVGLTVMSLIGFGLNQYSKLRLDAVFGFIISAIVIVNGIKLLVSSVRTLMGGKIPDEERERIREVCLSEESIQDIVRLAKHDYGANYCELIVEAVFTKDVNSATMTSTVTRLGARLKEEFGYEPKICINTTTTSEDTER